MKTIFLFTSALILATGAFLTGAWYSQHGIGNPYEKDRRILHYVDPMNPANISDQPGIAPCGMPMEPVYGDPETEGTITAGSGLSKNPGTIRIPLQKQQIIGVKIGKAEKMPGVREIRVPGRITPDENRIHSLFAATDGWVGNFSGSTTGSLVKKDQLMADIQVFNYDFYTWQQRYLTEFANTKRDHRGYPAALQPGSNQTPPPTTSALSPDGSSQTSIQQNDSTSDSSTQDSREPAVSSSGESPPEPRQQRIRPAIAQGSARQPLADTQGYYPYTALNINKSRLELLNLGVRDSQLDKFSETSQYISVVELRSPVNGLVISRGVFPNQRVDRGIECFRIADISRVWILADVFTAESAYIRPGMNAKISLPGQHRQFEARVTDVPSRFDPVTRTLKVRLEMENPKNIFLPDMFVDIKFQIPLPTSLTVPASAVLDSGRRQTVYAVTGEGVFEPRPVVTGWRSGDQVEILEGLVPGEQIVISGNFLMDSESRMRLAAAASTEKPETGQSEKPQPPSNNITDGSPTRNKSAANPMGHTHD